MSRAAGAVLAGMVLALALPSPADAHRPIDPASDGPTTIPDLEVSYAFYRVLDAGEVHRYRFEGRAGQELYAGITVPQIAGLEGYGVTLAVTGPGLPDLEEERAWVVPSEESGTFYEPFTQTRYRERQRISRPLPADGTYELVVWHPDGEAGRYVLDTGREERFGLLDVFLFPVWWVETNAYFGHWLRITAVLGAAAGLIVAAWKLGTRRGRRAAA